MKSILLLFSLFLGSLVANSQVISYTHDPSGNRIHRELVQLKSVQTTDTTAEEPVVTQMQEMRISIFSNPTQGALRIEITNLPEGSQGSITIWNLGGQEVLRIASISSSMVADMSSLPTGNYVMQMIVGEEKKEWTVVREK